MSAVERVVEAMAAGALVVVPTDTVYGLSCTPYREEPVRRLSELKGRSPDQPVALVAASVDVVLDCVPELRGRSVVVLRALLPGPFTLVLPNPAERFHWLTGSNPGTIGVRVPDVSGPARDLLEAVGAVAATSANLHGGPDPRRIADVPPEILAGVAATLDVGELPGTPSTVLDLTAREPRILRPGALGADEAMARLRSALGE